jgi:hypothetical protein
MGAMVRQVEGSGNGLAAVSPDNYTVSLVHRICCLAGSSRFLESLRSSLRRQGIVDAVASHSSAALFEWLLRTFSYRGIADAVAADYMRRYGSPSYTDVASSLRPRPACVKLHSYWQFYGCRFRKSMGTCAEPGHFSTCPLPRLHLRNGHLHQLAYSLFLFIRDVAGTDLVAWFDRRLAEAMSCAASDRNLVLGEAIVGPLRQVHGVSDKVLNVACADLLLGAGGRRAHWLAAGAQMVAVDTLVHNFLHRAGILHRLKADHLYGPACYRPGGCAEIIGQVAARIDAREFNRTSQKPSLVSCSTRSGATARRAG